MKRKSGYKPTAIKNNNRKRSFISRVWRFFYMFILYGFIFSILYTVLCKWVNPPITITEITSLITGHGLKRHYQSIDHISSNMKLAVLCGEDQLFTDHNGFDFESLQKALKHNRKSKSLRGASTISQQTAKNVFLWQHGGYFRKALEVYFTFLIEKIWGKKRILEVYLNVAEMGDGIFGADAAAHRYFNKTAAGLSAKEAAMIAAGLPNPKEYTIIPLSRRVTSRSQWILQQMTNLEGDSDIQELIN